MGLKNLKSNLDIHGGNQAISQGGNPGGILSNPNPPYDGGAFLAQGPEVGATDYDYDFHRQGEGNTDSPFEYGAGKGTYPGTDDHMVALLERRNVSSTNTDPLGPLGSQGTTNPMIYSPTPGGNGQGTLDEVSSLNNAQYGNGLFHGVSHPQHGQGYKVNGEDLHVALLDQTVSNYHRNSDANYGAGQPGGSFPGMKPSPSPSTTGVNATRYQDLNTTAGGIGDASGFAKYQNKFTNPNMEPSPNVIDTVSEQGLEGLYTSTVNSSTVYNNNWPTPSRNPRNLDLDGNTPNKYINNRPQ